MMITAGNINDTTMMTAVLEDIRRRGWTRPAEYVLALGITETLIEQVAVVRRLQGALVAGARRVSTE